jgi:hypothetical protein
MDKVHRDAVHEEEWVANVYGGRRTAASGSGTKDKADVHTDDEVFEVKYTEKRSFSLKLADLVTLQQYGYLKNKSPVFHVAFSDPILGVRRFTVIPEEEYRHQRSWIESAKIEMMM